MSRNDLIFYIALLFFLTLCTWIDKAYGQVNPLHEMFDGCGKGTYTPFTYTNEQGAIVTERYRIKVGCLKPGLKSFSLLKIRNDVDKINSAPLAMEHFDLTFQLLVRAQTELSHCIGAYEENQKLLKQKCLISDINCGGLLASSLINIRDYWISPFALFQTEWWKMSPPTLKTILLHFKLGAFGQNEKGLTGLQQWLATRDWCNLELDKIRILVKKKYKLK